ncbi:4-alpha-glucanotransferase [Amnibacterium sp. CER49]|uniref:4-alpha-glucanotransferase n=1 Tax=Amnibacterium sp. CER49 TaxID=3039161 RepID=UPI002446D890|nr:4-alpha-glucanotransferase [Amnibacterium sp. CER49]MDH2444231.1 4-alpha-glucanotransferase [Amnibacterium sp. CER49]
MTAPSSELSDLAAALGVATSFTDWQGTTVEVPAESIEEILTALGVDPQDPAAALAEHALGPWRRMLPPVVVTTTGAERDVPVHVPHGDPVEVEVRLETGGSWVLPQVDRWVDPREVDGALVGEATFRVAGDLPLGYHTLVATSGSTVAEAALIVTPARLELPERGWGVAAQLYSVRSQRSWGVGDLTDLTDLTVWAGAGLGADFVLVNPLHAAEPVAPLEPSPYLPSSRRFFNPLYLDVEAVPEFGELPAADRARIRRLGRTVRDRAAHAERIDRDRAWTAKRKALELVASVPRRAGRELDLQAYRRRSGRALTEFAIWSVLAEQHGNDARAWPTELRDPRSPAVAAFAAEHADGIAFAEWLQWLLDEQLSGAQAKALDAGMRIGTVHDLAVGVHPGGADAWRLGDAYATGITVGAPPDPFNQVGQDWLQPPWRPDRLAELGYAPFRDLLAAVLRHAGGVRVDHVIGLFRLWWVPQGRPASEGTYVHYDREALIGILALEAQRAGAVVVGEDLGVVDPDARRYLGERGILGTSILWFERGEGGGPLPAERWREACLATVTTHDLPPTAGYLAGAHVQLRAVLGLLTRPEEEELAADRAEQDVWLAELRRRGLLPEGADVEATVAALHRYLTLTPARLLGAYLTDLVGDTRTQNQPGTREQYPNWRVPLSGPDGEPMLLEDVFASARAAALARVLGG